MEQSTLLQEGEVLLEKVRKHWVVYVEDFILHLFACTIFLASAAFLYSRATSSFVSGGSLAQGTMILIMFVLIFWTSFFYFWTKNYFDVWYVTDRHIIAVNQKDMFEREEAFMDLSKIQDVSFEKNSFMATFFGYGRLKIQTAGSDQEFIIESVHDVESVAHRIIELRNKIQKGEAV